MNKKGFTKGPWRWSDESTNTFHEPTYSLLGKSGYGILSCDVPNSPQSCNGYDVSLIEAAPEMYEALYDAKSRLNQIASLLNGKCTKTDRFQAYTLAYDGEITVILAKARGEGNEKEDV